MYTVHRYTLWWHSMYLQTLTVYYYDPISYSSRCDSYDIHFFLDFFSDDKLNDKFQNQIKTILAYNLGLEEK